MLERAGQQVVVLERDDVGAAWTTRYDRLHLHTVRWLSCLPGYRMPRAFGSWPSRDCVVDYLRRYAEIHSLEVHAGVEVERVERGSEGWILRTAGGAIDAERVVVATGHSNVPYLPEWPGSFPGSIVHSASYRNPAPYRGRRVLVVGAGELGRRDRRRPRGRRPPRGAPRRAHASRDPPPRHARPAEPGARHRHR